MTSSAKTTTRERATYSLLMCYGVCLSVAFGLETRHPVGPVSDDAFYSDLPYLFPLACFGVLACLPTLVVSIVGLTRGTKREQLRLASWYTTVFAIVITSTFVHPQFPRLSVAACVFWALLSALLPLLWLVLIAAEWFRRSA